MHPRRVAIVVLTVLIAALSACTGESDDRASSGSNGDTTSSSSTAAATDSSDSASAGDADSPCSRLAGSLPFDGTWTPNYADTAAEARGFDTETPLGDVNYDRRLSCNLSNGGTAGLTAAANRIVDPAEWETTYAYRTGEAGCRAVEGPVADSKGYVCPSDDRTSFTTAVVGVGGWVYEVEFAGFDGATNEINRDVGPVTNPGTPTDATATEAAGSWIDAVGDPTAYDRALKRDPHPTHGSASSH